ncbi:MAG: AI-2E family transporter [Steroidobacteraceae bacterium]
MQPVLIPSDRESSNGRRVLLAIVGGVTGIACLVVIAPFLSPIAWAAILAYSSWPLYQRIRPLFRKLRATAAFVMTALLTCAVVVPVLWMLVLFGQELMVAYRALADLSAQGPYTLPGFIRRVPWVGEQLQQQINRYSAEPAVLMRQVGAWVQAWASELTALAGGIGRNVGKLLVTMVTVFFLYLDGETIIGQSRRVLGRFFGDRLDPYVATMATMTRSVVYGLVATAFAQGLVAGIGYAIVGISASILLGALTGLLSVVPMVGTGVVWGSVSVYLVVTGHIWKAVILAAWGLLLVHPTDNVLRPLLISNATRVPFLLVMFGVLGGMAAFGLVGAFVGPIILSMGLAAWREWAVDEES